MVIDGHVHIRKGDVKPIELLGKLRESNVSGAVLISLNPSEGSPDYRMANMMEWTEGHKGLVPFFWIDPMEPNAMEQVMTAIGQGAKGFKIICDSFYPGDDKCLSVCKEIAGTGKPVLFHSGILWDGKTSSEYCRPVHFESLLKIDGLRFSLAHIGWPWVDEMIAVYGKFLNFRTMNPESKTEMFIDMTPGTPMNFRKGALEKLIGTGYDIWDNMIFGSDCNANDYNEEWVESWITTDNDIFSGLGIDLEPREKVFGGNVRRFIENGQGKTFKKQSPGAF